VDISLPLQCHKTTSSLITLKPKNSNFEHSGTQVPIEKLPWGRKTRPSVVGSVLVGRVEKCHHGKVLPLDLVKASVHEEGATKLTYNQGHRLLKNSSQSGRNVQRERESFGLLIPYLERFAETNRDTVIDYDRESGPQKHIQSFFVCPGIMKHSVRYVRPVMSLDAMHMKKPWPGTFYTATVMTACNEIYPVAFAMMTGNEGGPGWIWFLQLLATSGSTYACRGTSQPSSH